MVKIKIKLSAALKGYRARIMGKWPENNPHPKLSIKYRNWFIGWTMADKDMAANYWAEKRKK